MTGQTTGAGIREAGERGTMEKPDRSSARKQLRGSRWSCSGGGVEAGRLILQRQEMQLKQNWTFQSAHNSPDFTSGDMPHW